jgi:Phage integrase family
LPPLARHLARLPRRTRAAQQRTALPARSARCRGDRRRHAPGRRRCPRRPPTSLDRAALAGGSSITDALTVTEHDLTPRVGWCSSARVRAAAAARSVWPVGWDHLRPWLELRMAMPVGPLLCVIDGPTRGRPWASDSARAQLRCVAAKAGVRRRFASHQLRHAHAVELAHEGVPLNVIPRQLGHRQRRDHRHRPRPQGADDPRQHPTPHLSRPRPRSHRNCSRREAALRGCAAAPRPLRA